jgi:hypothetical protein
MSNLSELLPAGAGAKSAEFVASGTLGSGVTVALKADGTVEAVASDANSFTQTIGTPSVFESAHTQWTGVAYDPSGQKLLVAYRDLANSGYGTAAVGTVSGSSITFGTPTVFRSADTQFEKVVFDSTAGKFVVAYKNSDNSGYAVVATVSGTSVSFGSNVQFTSANLDYPSPVYDSVNGKIVIVYQNGSVSDYGYYVVGTVSGTSISFGSEAAFNSVFSSYLGATYDPTSGSVIVGYGDFTNNDSMVIAGAVSGTSVSWGTAVAHDTVNPSFVNALAYDPDQNKTFLVYRRSTTVYAKVLTVSGTTITAGTADSLVASTNDSVSVTYHAAATTMVASVRQGGSGDGYIYLCTISGTTFSKSAAILFSDAARYISSTYDSTNAKVVIAYESINNSSYGTALTFNPTYTATNSADFIGITDQAIADTATGAVIVQGGVSEKAKGPITSSVGTATTFSASLAPLSSIVYDEANNKVVVVFRDASNSGYGTAIVGTVSGTSISWGTPTVFQSAGLSPSEIPQVTYDPDTEQIITAYLVGNVGRYAVGSVSGTTISFGSSGAFETGNTTWISLAYDTANSRVVIAYRYNTAPATDDGYAVVGTVSGTSISFGSRVLFDGGSVSYTSTVYDSNAGKIVIVYNSSGAKAVVGTVSGTSISFGSIATITMTLPNMTYSDLVYDAGSQKVVFVTRESLTPFYGLALVGTVSGTSISFGTEVEFTADGINWMAATYDSTLGKTIICYEEQTDIGKFVLGTVSGTSISFTSPEIFNASATDYVRGATYDSNQQAVVVTFTLTSAPYYGKATAISLTAPLTPNTDYYVQADGTLSTTISSAPAGRALSTTSILLEG